MSTKTANTTPTNQKSTTEIVAEIHRLQIEHLLHITTALPATSVSYLAHAQGLLVESCPGCNRIKGLRWAIGQIAGVTSDFTEAELEAVRAIIDAREQTIEKQFPVGARVNRTDWL